MSDPEIDVFAAGSERRGLVSAGPPANFAAAQQYQSSGRVVGPAHRHLQHTE